MPRNGKDIVGQLVSYMRDNKAFHDTGGIYLSASLLAKGTIDGSEPGINISIHRLLDTEVIVMKSGKIKVGRSQSTNPDRPHFVLTQGYEKGESWREKVSGTKPPSTSSPRSKKTKVLTDKNVLAQLLILSEELKQARQELIDCKERLNTTLQENKQLSKSVLELREELDQAEEQNRDNQHEIQQMTARIQENMGELSGLRIREHKLNRELAGYNS